MADKQKNMFSTIFNAKNRLVVAVLVVIAVLGGILYVWHHVSKEKVVMQGSADVVGSPAIDSVPGAGNPTNQYVQNQNLQNQLQAEQARKDATSSVPTITRSGFVGNPDAFGELPAPITAAADSSTSSHALLHNSLRCPLKKVVVMYKPNPANCTLANLQLAREAGVTAEELLCQGCSCPLLKTAGYTIGDLKSVGYTASQLKSCGFTLGQLMEAGFSAADLKAAGYSAKQLADVGFTAGQLAAAGFTPDELNNAGYSQADLQAAGVGNNSGSLNPACSEQELVKEHAAGVSAADLKAKGCGIAGLKAAGYTASELKAAGFTAEQLKSAGFNAGDLQAAGFSAKDLKDAGFSASALKEAGFNDQDLAAAGFTPAEIKAAQEAASYCNLTHLKALREQGVSAVDLKNHGCGLAGLKAAGYTAGELKAAGFSADQLKNAGFTAADLKSAGYSAEQLKDAGYSAADLKGAGFTADDLKNAGFSAAQLKAAGFSAQDLKNAGFSAANLRDAGYSAASLHNAGFSASDLKAAGFSAGELKDAGFSAADLNAAGFSAKQLHDAGYSAADLKAAGFTPGDLQAAGYTHGDLLRAGFTPAQAGYSARQLANGSSSPLGTASAADNGGSTLTGSVGGSASGAPAFSGRRGRSQAFNQTGRGAAQTAGAAMPSISDDTPEAQLARLARLQQRQMSLQQQQDVSAQMQGAMTMQSQKLLAEWSNNPTQTLAKAPVVVENNGGAAGGATDGANGTSTGTTIKAGTVMFAVLDTSINSDENSPILAHIVTGPMKGAKLLGHFSRVNQRVLISFNLLNEPHFDRSIGINAVAIDPDTARTAVSGQVNNHYLLRYGTLFAASFLQGLSNALLQSGTTQGCVGPFCWTSRSHLSPVEQGLVGLGNVGEQFSSTMGQIYNTPPTVKVQGGTGIGVLLMSDLNLPTAPVTDEAVASGGEEAPAAVEVEEANPSPNGGN